MAKTSVVALVEADDDLRGLFLGVLSRAGYEVRHFASAEDFLREETGQLGDYDLVILDYVMSGMNGQALCRQIKAARPDLPVVIESGMVGQEFIDECLSAGAGQVLIKPFPVSRLLSVVEEMITPSGQ